MPKILSVQPEENFFKSLYHKFLELDRFTRLAIIFFVLVGIATPVIVRSYHLLRSLAGGAQVAEESWTGANGDPWSSQWTFVAEKELISGGVPKIGEAVIQDNKGRIYGQVGTESAELRTDVALALYNGQDFKDVELRVNNI